MQDLLNSKIFIARLIDIVIDQESIIGAVLTFQINTKGAEVLYSTVKEIAEVSPVTTLLDICCGTGENSCYSLSVLQITRQMEAL